jgi:hypothetical protein
VTHATFHAAEPTGLEPVLLRLLAGTAGEMPVIGPFRRRADVALMRTLTGTGLAEEELCRRLNEVRLVRRYLDRRLPRVEAGRAGSWIEYSLSDALLQARSAGAPILFVFWHAGIISGIFPSVSIVAPDIRMIKSGKVFRDESATLGVFETVEDSADRSLGNARMLKAAIAHLGKGGTVGTFIDGTNGESGTEVSFFGRPVRVRRGTAMLARTTGAAVFPCVCRWDTARGRLRFLVGERIYYPSATAGRTCRPSMFEEQEFLQACVGWFERHLRQYPEDLTRAAVYILEQAGAQAR